MIAVLEKPKNQPPGQEEILPRLENGDHLTAGEFLRRYEAMPEVKKAELVCGIVYMGSPVRVDQHGEPDALIKTWLGTYSIATPGVKHGVNATVRLGPDDVLQPDGFLRLAPEYGGNTKFDSNGYLVGPPDLVVEVAASSVSIEERGFIEVQIEFGAIEGLKERKFVAPGAELAEAFFQRIKRGEEVGNDNHEPALLD